MDMTAIRRSVMAAAELKLETVTGTTLNFTTMAVMPLQECAAAFSPVQNGSGTPSPSNVRPITGRTGITIYRSGPDTSSPESFAATWQTEAGTVYAGSVDVATGVLTINEKLITLNGESGWRVSGTNKFYCPMNVVAPDMKHIINLPCVSNMYAFGGYSNSGSSGVSVNGNYYLQYYGSDDHPEWNRTWVYDTSYTLEQFKMMLNTTPLQATYPITPVTVQLDPVTIETLAGVNIIWSDASGNMTVKYYKL